jgi:hypothetical protein
VNALVSAVCNSVVCNHFAFPTEQSGMDWQFDDFEHHLMDDVMVMESSISFVFYRVEVEGWKYESSQSFLR